MLSYDRSLLADLNIFLLIVRCGSLSQAAIDLNVTPSALSHRLRKLENHLGVRLLNRTSRSSRPTDAGRTLAAQLKVSFQGISDALMSLEQHRRSPMGRLRINTLRDGTRCVLGPVLPRFLATFPEIELEVASDDRMVDIVDTGFDAGIRYGDRVPKDMIGVALTPPQRWVVVAAPSLTTSRKRPDKPDDLRDLPCIRLRNGSGTTVPWELGEGDRTVRIDPKGPLCVNETDHAIDAALRGTGFAYVLERRVIAELASGALELVLPDWTSQGAAFTIYYSSRRQPPPGMRQLVEMIRDNEGLPPMVTLGVVGSDSSGPVLSSIALPGQTPASGDATPC